MANLEKRYERVKRDQTMRGHHCDYRVAIEAELQSLRNRAQREISRLEWEWAKDFGRRYYGQYKSDDFLERVLSGIGLTLPDNLPSEEKNNEE